MRSQKLANMNVWPPVLACGAWLKNAACLLQHDQVLWSPVHGDLSDPQSCLDLEASLERLLTLAETTPCAVAHDLHPDFYSSQLAVSLAERLDVPALAVQHHHAHVAALMAEHGLDGPVMGLALDGVGLGSDGAAWGGELLWVGPHAWRRLGHLLPLPLPGGDIAAREPWRLTAASLHLLGRDAEITPRLGPLVGEQSAGTVAGMLRRELNCPPSSGAGRWFDAAAGILGLSVRQQAEAEAAIALERVATEYLALNADPVVDGLWRIQSDGVLDLRRLLSRLFDLADHGRSAEGAAVFHLALAAALADWVLQKPGNLPVVLGGGCFANRLLSARLTHLLGAEGVQVFSAHSVSCGDAGLALGQGWIAAHWPEFESQAAPPLEELPCA
ncbi:MULTISPECIES: carbamoyltransferase HypF [unclassified Pseudomonas]|uniref:Kae1-like domain-containing protein n=1 Tax=unclassified Pseudomonas TaxID=196821 RepID=UPI002AC9E52D|nr:MULTISPECIES: carbamoyltransferase HypF [unclassified Pseudomonas]MEB0041112.1 carbamoyltransferase HypF [Pseudomonas sp. MH10]MEB0120296.1 carbamoyltransferase HypF [Pseudomonas sp. CCI1.2]WPX65646.1 carbamoyltransferase HypF [Pseudomonas sp. MH10]